MISRSLSLTDQSLRVFKSLTSPRLRYRAKLLVKSLSSLQLPTRGDNIFLFSTPRSGSTWLSEMILSQPGFRDCDQPLDVRNVYVREKLGIATWDELHDRRADHALKPYLQAICAGRIRGLATLGSHHRLISCRLVFKIQNGWQERIAWMQESFGGRVVLLLRHPIAVTLSRQQFPRLNAFLDSDYAHQFGDEALAMARRIVAEGSRFEQGILHWCFENALPLRQYQSDPTKPDWTVLTYEQLVSDPERIVPLLADVLDLPDPAAIMGQISKPSRTTSKSSAEAKTMVESDNRRHLISKWRKAASEEDERRAFEIVEAFGIDAYRPGEMMPAETYLLRAQGERPEAGDRPIARVAAAS